jgi:hypothetical protein
MQKRECPLSQPLEFYRAAKVSSTRAQETLEVTHVQCKVPLGAGRGCVEDRSKDPHLHPKGKINYDNSDPMEFS